MYKIYVNNLPIILAGEGFSKFNYYDKHELQFQYEESADITSVLQYAKHYPEARRIILTNPDVQKLKTEFFKNFMYLSAGGGVVFNDENEILLIYRNDRWDLPKGKLKKDEDIEKGSLREVAEETNVNGAKIIEKGNFPELLQDVTYHTYMIGKVPILKATHWYVMHSSEEEELIPQKEEGIEKVEWVSIDDLSENFKDTYATIKEVINSALNQRLLTS